LHRTTPQQKPREKGIIPYLRQKGEAPIYYSAPTAAGKPDAGLPSQSQTHNHIYIAPTSVGLFLLLFTLLTRSAINLITQHHSQVNLEEEKGMNKRG